ncbi:cysteine hydrolase family protein [Peribacillus sp. SCS-37]|uniref:cysteine hydrolase family protein n=1 Tax=Paraperibacillus esterisolvens TaxID=3115296 RepID=UPI0039057616
MYLFDKKTALLILDVQKGFDDPYWGERCNPEAEMNISRLLAAWRERSMPVIYSQHLSKQPDSPINENNKHNTEFKDTLKPAQGETVFTKQVNSAFIGTELEVYLRRNDIMKVVITGLSTQHCVSTTTRMSGNLGFSTYLVSDATAAFGTRDHEGTYYPPEVIQKVELAQLHKEFGVIAATEEILHSLEV